jgi:1,4-alpha-glucan branching enzyme
MLHWAAALFCLAILLNGHVPAVTVFSDGFETGSIASPWTTGGTGNWRVQTSTSSGYKKTGTYGVTLDDSVSGGYSYTRLDLRLNLASYKNVVLNLQMRNVGADSSTNHGVYLSTDGTNFYKTSFALPTAGATWYAKTLNLSTEATNLGLKLGPSTTIRLQIYDDYPLATDGVAIDDVSVTGDILPTSLTGMGPLNYTGGTAFRVWAPNASLVTVTGTFNSWNATDNKLANEGNGNWSVDVNGALPDNEYLYVVTYNNTQTWKADPRSVDVTNSVGNSIIRASTFNWDASFTMPAWNEMVVYEMHIGTYNDTAGGSPGTWTSATSKLDRLQTMGINMIELMPIAEFAGDFSWGYNPAHLFAPESAYGTPDNLRTFVNEAHRRGIGVIVDVVHNHYGPSDLDRAYWNFDGPSFGNGGIYFFSDWRKTTPWGDTRPDYGRTEVRDFIKDNALYWLDTFHCDGLRWDSTVNIRTQNNGSGGDIAEGWSVMQYANNAIDGSQAWKISIAEDLQNNDWITKTTGSGGAGFDSQWDARFVHPIRTAIIAGNDADRDMNAVRDAIAANYNGQATQRVIYTESHDEVANGHSRVPEEIWPGNASSWYSKKRSTLGAGLVFTSPGIPMIFQGQEFLEDGYFADSDPLDWAKDTTYSGIRGLYTDLAKLRRNWNNNTRGLRGNNVNVHHVNNTNKVIAFHRWENGGAGDDVIVVANFGGSGYASYNLGFPAAGNWYVRFNSDWNGYDGTFGNWNSYNTTAFSGAKDGMNYNANIGIGPYSLIILSQ